MDYRIPWLKTEHLLPFSILFTGLVAGAVADINKMVAAGDSKNTLQALQVPSAGLKAVLPECANTYQTELAQRQAYNANKGNLTCRTNIKKGSSVLKWVIAKQWHAI